MSLLAVTPRTVVSPPQQSHEIGALAATVRRHQATLNGVPGTKLDAEWLRTVMADTTRITSSLQKIGERITSIDDPSLQCDFRILRRDLACLQNRVKCYVSRSQKKEPESAPTPPPPVAPKIRLPSKRALTVSKMPCNPATYEKIRATALQWQQIIWEKLEPAPVLNPHIFESLKNISEHIAFHMKYPKPGYESDWDSIYICEDVALKEIQAIALVCNHTKGLKISFLATHPRNVRSPLNETERTRVEGAASALIRHLAAEQLGSGKDIYLEATWSSIPFYEKLGFERDPALRTSGNSMYLSAQKIELLCQKAA